jgi:assimilatory nitrate reductase catalytic subunit
MRLVAVKPAPAPAPDPAFPLRLNTGRYRDQWHTMTRTGYAPRWPSTGARRCWRCTPRMPRCMACRWRAGAGGNGGGASVFRVCVTDGQRRGDIFVPMHWTDVMAGGARANMLPGQGTDPVSGQPGFKNTPARVVPLAPEWRGFLLRRDGVAPEGLLWWSRSR